VNRLSRAGTAAIHSVCYFSEHVRGHVEEEDHYPTEEVSRC